GGCEQISILTGQFHITYVIVPPEFSHPGKKLHRKRNLGSLLNVVKFWRCVLGTTERRERERQELRVRILDAARELFAELGYDAVTMRKIAERIEYSPTPIYFHFKDKARLLPELCELDFAALAHEFRKIAKEKDPIERLRKIGHAYVGFGIDYPNHYRLMFMTPHPPIAHTKEYDAATRGNP